MNTWLHVINIPFIDGEKYNKSDDDVYITKIKPNFNFIRKVMKNKIKRYLKRFLNKYI